MQQRFQPLEKQFDLPAQAVQLQQLHPRGLLGGQGSQHPNDLAVASSAGYRASLNPGDGAGQRPGFVAFGRPWWGYWNKYSEFYGPDLGNLIFLAEQRNPPSLRIA